jgi:flagellar biosynthesis GTPase FlhF
LSTSEKELNQKKRKRENRENEASEESVSTTKRPKQEKTEPTDTISSTSVKRDEGDHHQNIVHSNEEAESHLINVDTLRWSKLMKRTLKKVWILFFCLEIFPRIIRHSLLQLSVQVHITHS